MLGYRGYEWSVAAYMYCFNGVMAYVPSVVTNTRGGICVRMAKSEVIRQTAGFRKFEYCDSSANILPPLMA